MIAVFRGQELRVYMLLLGNTHTERNAESVRLNMKWFKVSIIRKR